MRSLFYAITFHIYNTTPTSIFIPIIILSAINHRTSILSHTAAIFIAATITSALRTTHAPKARP